MSLIDKVVEKFPEELRLPMFEALTVVKEESKELIAREEISKVWKAIERLAEAQERAEVRLTSLEEKMAELVEAQRKTEQRLTVLEEKMAELAEAQRKTENAILELTKGLKNLRKDFGGFSLTMSYAFENEAFKHLPKVLKEKYKINVEEKFIRQELGGKEINIFAKGKMNGEEVYIIGES